MNGEHRILPEAFAIREANYQRAARNADFYTFSEHGKPIEAGDIPQIEAALLDYLESGESWRAKGTFEFVNGSMPANRTIHIELEMSYNADLDVYKFFLDGWRDDDPALKEYLGVKNDGEFLNFAFTDYYIKEDGKFYALRDAHGSKSAHANIEADPFFSFLMSLRPQNVIDTSYLDDEYMISYRVRGVESFRLDDGSVFGYIITGNEPSYDLRLFEGKPVTYNDGNADAQVNGRYSQIYYNFEYFYNKIPEDKPSIADWK